MYLAGALQELQGELGQVKAYHGTGHLWLPVQGGKGGFQLELTTHGLSPCKHVYFSIRSCLWSQANISHPQGSMKVSSTAAWQRATSPQPPTVLPTRESTRSCLLQASCDFAALSHNAPASLPAEEPCGFSHSSHGNHQHCWLSTFQGQWSLWGSAITGLSASPCTCRTQLIAAHHPQLIAAFPPPLV